jgi:hypothetical protein
MRLILYRIISANLNNSFEIIDKIFGVAVFFDFPCRWDYTKHISSGNGESHSLIG